MPHFTNSQLVENYCEIDHLTIEITSTFHPIFHSCFVGELVDYEYKFDNIPYTNKLSNFLNEEDLKQVIIDFNNYLQIVYDHRRVLGLTVQDINDKTFCGIGASKYKKQIEELFVSYSSSFCKTYKEFGLTVHFAWKEYTEIIPSFPYDSVQRVLKPFLTLEK